MASQDIRRYIRVLEQAGQQEPVYIRFGKIPETERSTIFASPNIIHALVTQGRRQEFGVSVYDAKWNEQRKLWQIVDCGNLATLDELIDQAQHKGLDILLVTGTPVEAHMLSPEDLEAHRVEGNLDHEITGADGETLLRNVRIVKDLTLRDIYEPNVFDPDRDLPKPPTDHRFTAHVFVVRPNMAPEDHGIQKLTLSQIGEVIAGPDTCVERVRVGPKTLLCVDEDARIRRSPLNDGATRLLEGRAARQWFPPEGIRGTCVFLLDYTPPPNEFEP